MPDEPMTLVERLRNPAWVHDFGGLKPALAVEQTIADMNEAADMNEELEIDLAGAVANGRE